MGQDKNENTWILRELIYSKALASLKSPAAIRVLLIFFTKRQMFKSGRRGKKEWITINNGVIEFTYAEAEMKYNIPYSTFRNAIDELRDKGFIDIARSGQGTYKVKNLYAICNRWQKYGTSEYEQPKSKPKGPINRGFQKGNSFGRNSKKVTVVEQHGSTVKE